MCRVCDRDQASKDIIEAMKFRYWDHDYCSFYCQRFDELKLTKYQPSTNVHTQHFDWYPPIQQTCEGCEKTFELRWARELANRQFCCRKCQNKRGPRKRSRKAYWPLKILKHSKNPIPASDFIPRLEGQKRYLYTTSSVAQILRNYVTKNIVEVVEGKWPHANVYTMSEWAKQKPLKELLV